MSKILILPGDGIGEEVTKQCLKILDYLNSETNYNFEYKQGLFGGASIDDCGKPLSNEVLDLAMESDAVLLGAVGGPKWESLDHNLKPEKGLLTLRKELGTFANLKTRKSFSCIS